MEPNTLPSANHSYIFHYFNKERLEGKETSEPDKEEDVHVSERDRRLAEQVSIHNVGFFQMLLIWPDNHNY